MPNKYDNIDYCLNIMYDFVYNKSSDCYELNYTSKNNIDISQLKKSDNFDYKYVLNNDITFVHNNKDKLVFKRHSKTSFPTMMRVSMYDKDANTHNMNLDEINDMKLNYIFSDLAINNIHKFIILPIFNFDVTYDELKKLNKSMSDEIKKHYKDITNDNRLCIQIFEHYFKMKTLREYLDENIKEMNIDMKKAMIFQVLYALYSLQKAYPTFRHNSLDLDSIYVYIKNGETQIETRYNIDDKVYNIPNIGFEIKLTNFYDSTIKNITYKKKQENSYYDVHYFLCSLLQYLKEKLISIDFELNNFFDEIIPLKYRTKNKNNLGLDEAYFFQNVGTILNPMNIIIKNNFFANFIKEDIINLMTSSISNNEKNINSFREEEGSIDYMLSSSITDSGRKAVTLAKKRSSDKKATSSKMNSRQVNNSQVNNSQVNNRQVNNKKHYRIDDMGLISESSEGGDMSSSINERNNKRQNNKQNNKQNKKNNKKSKKNEDDSSSSSSSSPKQARASNKNESSDDSSDDFNFDDEPKTEGAPANPAFNFMNKLAVNQPKKNIFSAVESIGNAKYENQMMDSMSRQMADLERMEQSAGKQSKKSKKSKKNRNNNTESDMSRLPEGLLPEHFQNQLSMNSMNNPMMGNQMMGNQMMGNQMMGNPMMGMQQNIPQAMTAQMINGQPMNGQMPIHPASINTIVPVSNRNGMDGMGGPMGGPMGNPMGPMGDLMGANPMMGGPQMGGPQMGGPQMGMNPMMGQMTGQATEQNNLSQSIFLPSKQASQQMPLMGEGNVSQNAPQAVPQLTPQQAAPQMASQQNAQDHVSLLPQNMLMGSQQQQGGSGSKLNRSSKSSEKKRDFFF